MKRLGSEISPRLAAVTAAFAAACALWAVCAQSAQAAEYKHVCSFGGAGAGSGLFTEPHRVAIDTSTGFLFVADSANNRVQAFKSKACPSGAEPFLSFPSPSPFGIAVDKNTGDVYTTHPSVNEKQTLTVAGATGGTFKPCFDPDGGGAQPPQCTAATGTGDFSTSSKVITNVNTTSGTFAVGQALTVTAPVGATLPANAEISAINTGAGTITFTGTSNPVCPAAATSCSVTLSAPGIRSGATATKVQNALLGLPAIGTGNIAVSGTAPYTATFQGALAAKDVAQMTCDGSALTPGTATCTPATLLDGAAAAVEKYKPDSHATPTSYAKDPGFTSPAVGAGEEQIGSLGSGAAASAKVAAIAVDPTGAHDIVIGDPGQNKVKRFTSAGAFVSSFDGSSSGASFVDVNDVALNSKGEPIVADRTGTETVRILRFSPSGASAASLAPAPVNKDTATRVALAANPTTDEVFVSSKTGGFAPINVCRFDAADAFVDCFTAPSEFEGGPLGFASDGATPARLYALGSASLVSPTAKAQVFETEPIFPSAPGVEFPVAGEEAVRDITHTSATFHGAVNPDSNPLINDDVLKACRFEYVTQAKYEADGNSFANAKPLSCDPSAAAIGEGTTYVAVEATATGLDLDTQYRVRLLAEKERSTPKATIVAAAPFSTAKVPPVVGGELATSVGETFAGLRAFVNPNHSVVGECRFEYLAEAAFEDNLEEGEDGFSGASSAGCEPSPGAGRDPVEVTAALDGLTLDTAYRFRVLADNGVEIDPDGDPGNTTAVGPGARFRTYPAIAFPERGYELVSAFATNGGLAVPDTAADDGNHYAYTTSYPTPGSESGQASYFRATRHVDGSWTQQHVGSPAPPAGNQSQPPGAAPVYSSADLSSAVFTTLTNRLDPHDQNRAYDVFLKVAGESGLTWLSCTPALPARSCPPEGGAQTEPIDATTTRNYYVSPEGTRALFESNRDLLPEDVSGPIRESLYEWDEGQLSLVSLKPGLATGFTGSSALGSFTQASDPNRVDDSEMRQSSLNAVSLDGSRVVFQAVDSSTDRAGDAHLYVRIDGDHTVEVSAPAAGVPAPVGDCNPGALIAPAPCDVNFWGADANVESIFFSTTGRLTADSSAVDGTVNEHYGPADSADLYRYSVPADGDPAHGHLVDLTPVAGGGGVWQVLDVSDDGRRVYFIANGGLTPGASAGDCSNGGLAGTCNLYLAALDGPGDDSPQVTLIAEVDMAFGRQPSPRYRNVAANADGSVLAFRSADALVADRETGGKAQVYVYDAGRGSLGCASCPVDGSTPAGRATLTSWAGRLDVNEESEPSVERDLETIRHRRHDRNVSTTGHVFFQSTEPLLPGDSNGRVDLYEYYGGRLDRISSGTAPSASVFGDASLDGSKVFFATRDALVPGVQADVPRVYAAVVGGGFEPPLPEPPCTGEDCKPVAAAQPNYAAPATGTIAGRGNLSEPPKRRRCPKGKARRGSRCVAKRVARKRTTHSTRRASR